MIVTNGENLPGKRTVAVLGVVTGNIVEAKHIGRDIMAGLKSIVGGEIEGYSELLAEARKRAHQRMVGEARELGANAVTNCRYTTSMIMQGMSEVLAFGTAVRVEDE